MDQNILGVLDYDGDVCMIRYGMGSQNTLTSRECIDRKSVVV